MEEGVLTTLKKCKLFSDVKEEVIISIAENFMEESECEKNYVIFDEKKYTRSLVIIIKGKASVTKDVDNKKILMSVLGAGDLFGMASLFYEKDYFLTTVTALEKTSMLTISKENLTKIFSLYPNIGENYIKILSEKIHFLNSKIGFFTASRTLGKVSELILTNLNSEKNRCVLPYSVTSLANVLNIGRASVYRAFDVLEREGIIKRSGKIIDILDFDSLNAYALTS